jgi:L-asparagine transporter-like permease
MLKTIFKVIFYAALTLFTLFAIYIADDRRMSAFATIIWLFALYSEWQGDRNKAKAKEEAKLKQLTDRVAYLERQQRP